MSAQRPNDKSSSVAVSGVAALPVAQPEVEAAKRLLNESNLDLHSNDERYYDLRLVCEALLRSRAALPQAQEPWKMIAAKQYHALAVLEEVVACDPTFDEAYPKSRAMVTEALTEGKAAGLEGVAYGTLYAAPVAPPDTKNEANGMGADSAVVEEPSAPRFEAALSLYKPPFRHEHGYIFDADGHMVADDDPDHSGAMVRVRGWGRIQYKANPEGLHDEVGDLIALALTEFYSNRSTRKP